MSASGPSGPLVWQIFWGFPYPNYHRLFCVILWQSEKCKSVMLDRMELYFPVRITKGLMRLRGWRLNFTKATQYNLRLVYMSFLVSCKIF